MPVHIGEPLHAYLIKRIHSCVNYQQKKLSNLEKAFRYIYEQFMHVHQAIGQRIRFAKVHFADGISAEIAQRGLDSRHQIRSCPHRYCLL